MGGINLGRVVLGGLLAGLVFNLGETILNAVVLVESMEGIVQEHNLRSPTGADIGLFIVLGFALGILLVWLYAAVRPRLGPGPKTAVMVGVAVWFPGYFMPVVGWLVFGLSPLNPALITIVWGLVELVLSALAGAWLYQEA